MATYALIAKYRGAPAVYTRESDGQGGLSASERVAENVISYAVAKKVVAENGWVLVKSWKDAEPLAAAELQAEEMDNPFPLQWKNKVNGWHRAKTEDGIYNIRRWFLRDGEWVAGPADGSAVGAAEDRKWVITFEATDVDYAETVPWWKSADELIHSLDHAKTSCQYHANARMLAMV